MSPSATNGGSKGPFEGIVVIDLSHVLAGPFCTMLLSDLGARVIKVERPGSGDDSRAFGPFLDDKSLYFGFINRGKQSIALDLKHEDDRTLFESMVRKADVLVENFRPGTMDRLRYTWEALSAMNPRLVYASASGYGQTGPKRTEPAYDTVIQGMSGLMSLTGFANGPATKVGTSIADTAVVDGDLRLTYEELHARACRLAGSGKISKKVLRAPYWTHYDKEV